MIIHGAGSFGHIVAAQYDIVDGFKENRQLEGLIAIRNDMNELSTKVTFSLLKAGLKAVSFQTSSLVYGDDEASEKLVFVEPLLEALKLGITPVLSGDVIFSAKKSFTILSGDRLIEYLVQKIDVNRVVFISDVDGLYIKKPETNEPVLVTSLYIDDLTDIQLANLNSNVATDVTGNMLGKYNSIRAILQFVDEVIIVNGNYPKRIFNALSRIPDKYTIIKRNSSNK